MTANSRNPSSRFNTQHILIHCDTFCAGNSLNSTSSLDLIEKYQFKC
uniref:Uncharacterized protein n=1 Tax=Anguilla anguilla TaxID=7936 RepID=A0A0E9V1N8_ANGAN